MTDKVFNLFITIVYIVAIGVVIYGFISISTTDTVKLDDYTRESLLDEYNARAYPPETREQCFKYGAEQ